MSPVLFEIRGKKKSQIVHHDRIKLCKDRFIPIWLRRLRHEFLGLANILQDDYDEENPDQEEDNRENLTGFMENLSSDSSDENSDVPPDSEQMCTRRGRVIKRPSYLRDYSY